MADKENQEKRNGMIVRGFLLLISYWHWTVAAYSSDRFPVPDGFCNRLPID